MKYIWAAAAGTVVIGIAVGGWVRKALRESWWTV